jgi:hypothetical protein
MHCTLDFCPRPARMETNLPLHTFEKLRGYCPNIYTVLCSQLGVSYAHSFKSSFISVAEIFPLFIILDRRESNCQKLVATWGSTKLILEILHLIANYQHIVLVLYDLRCMVSLSVFK